MAITLGTAPSRIGPGMRVAVTGLSGPIPTDDFLQVQLTETSTGTGYTYGTKLAPTTGFNLVTIGYDQRLGRVVNGDIDPPAQGAAMSAQAFQYHANGTLVTSTSAISYGVLDSLGYLFGLFQYTGASGTASLDDILNAVRTTFPATS